MAGIYSVLEKVYILFEMQNKKYHHGDELS